MNIVTLVDEYKEASSELLNECIADQFDTVIVLGFYNDSKAFKIKASKTHDRLYILGALAEAKQHILEMGST